jgi:hypothetical protein
LHKHKKSRSLGSSTKEPSDIKEMAPGDASQAEPPAKTYIFSPCENTNDEGASLTIPTLNALAPYGIHMVTISMSSHPPFFLDDIFNNKCAPPNSFTDPIMISYATIVVLLVGLTVLPQLGLFSSCSPMQQLPIQYLRKMRPPEFHHAPATGLSATSTTYQICHGPPKALAIFFEPIKWETMMCFSQQLRECREKVNAWTRGAPATTKCNNNTQHPTMTWGEKEQEREGPWKRKGREPMPNECL